MNKEKKVKWSHKNVHDEETQENCNEKHYSLRI